MTRGDARIRRVVGLYTAFQFFFALLLWIPVFYEYQKRMGLSDGQIYAIQSLYYVVFCLFEIPTGYLADRLGYLFSMRVGAAVLVGANLSAIFFTSYLGFLIHWVLIALSRSLISGASSAYLYDYLKGQGREADYKQAEGNARAYGLVGKVVCWAGIGLLMKWHLTLPYWLTATSAAVSVGFALSLPGLSPTSPGAPRPGLGPLAELAPVARVLADSPLLVVAMLQGVAIFLLVRMCQVNLFQPILGSKSFDLGAYGLVMSLTTVFEALGSYRVGWLRGYLSDLSGVFLLSAVAAASLSLIAVTGVFGTLVGLCLFSLASGLCFPIQRQVVNDAIPGSQYRATLLSFESIVDRAACALVAPVLGAYVASGRMETFMHGLAISTIFSLAALYLLVGWIRRREIRIKTL